MSRTRLAVLGAAVVVLIVAVVLATRDTDRAAGSLIPKAQAIEMGEACTTAAVAKLQPLVVEVGAEVRFDRIDGTDWTVRTTVNHKTKWSDNWYDVTCVIGWTSPKVAVRSVAAVPRAGAQ